MSGRRKRRASRSPSPARPPRKRADDGPVVLRRARPGPSLADLPTELAELVVRCAAVSTPALVRLARTCRALERTARGLVLTIFIDHGVVALRNARWEFVHDVQPKTVPNDRPLVRGYPLTECLDASLSSSSLWHWLEIKTDDMMRKVVWCKEQCPKLVHLQCPWPTAVYRARFCALVDAWARLDLGSGCPSVSPKLDLPATERLVAVLGTLFDDSHAAMRAVSAAAAEHPSLFTTAMRTHLRRQFAHRLVRGEPSIDDVAERLRIICATIDQQCRLFGAPSSVVSFDSDICQKIGLLLTPEKTVMRAVASHAADCMNYWLDRNVKTLTPADLAALVTVFISSGHGELVDNVHQASRTQAGRVLLYDLRLHVLFANDADQAAILAHLLPHYLGALRGCVPKAS